MKFNFFILLAIILLLSNCGPKITNTDFLNRLPKQIVTNSSNVNDILKKQVKDMTFQEAAIAKEYYQDSNSKEPEMVIKCAERLLAVGGDQEVLRKSTLELAEIFLEKGNFDKAQKYSQDYQSYWPGTQQAKRAAFIAIQSNFLSTLNSYNDQTKTEKTLEIALDFVKKYKDDKEYCKSVRDMTDTCYRKLIDREVYVANGYLKQYNYNQNFTALNAAYRRVAHIRKKLLPNLESEEKRILEFEIQLAQASNNTNLIKQKESELNKKYGSSTIIT